MNESAQNTGLVLPGQEEEAVQTPAIRKPAAKRKTAAKRKAASRGRQKTRPSTKQAVDKSIRKPAKRRRLKTDFSYLQEENPGKVLRLMNNEGGRIQMAINDGWEPVKGIGTHSVWTPETHRKDADTVAQKTSVVQIPASKTTDLMHILMMIDKDLFDELERAPIRERVALTEAALGMGKNNSAGEAAGVTGIETYAPNLPSGGVGFEQQSVELLE